MAASVEQPASFEESIDLRALTPRADGAFGVANPDKPARFSKCAAGQVLSRVEPLSQQILRPRTPTSASDQLALGTGVPPVLRWMAGGTLAVEQLAPLTRGLAAKALCGNTLCPLRLGAFEGVKATPNRLTVHAELLGEVDHARARANPTADPLDLRVCQLGLRWHTISVLPWDISRDISI